MKSISFLFMGALLITLYSCNSKKTEGTATDKNEISTDVVSNPITASGDNKGLEDLPKIEFKVTNYDFGAIVQGEKVSYVFKFKNTGKKDLVISGASATCGCTVPKYGKEPIAPGKEGELEVVFDSTGKSGSQRKVVTVLANTQPNTTELTITADIIIPK